MILKGLKSLLEKIDKWRDQLFFLFIKNYWPRFILPNHLTILRIILAIVLFFLLLTGYKDRIGLVIVFLIAAILDLFDGSVARTLNKESRLGAFLDIVADRLLIFPVIFFILIKDYFLLLVCLILPELISGLIVIYYKISGIVIKANIFGKTKMVFECVAFAYIILFNFPNPLSSFPIVLLYSAVIFAFLNIILNVLVPPPKIKPR